MIVEQLGEKLLRVCVYLCICARAFHTHTCARARQFDMHKDNCKFTNVF